MEISIASTAILSGYGLFICRRKFTFAMIAVVVIVSTTSSLAYGISDHFTGEGVTAAVIYDVLYGTSGLQAAGFDKFPLLAALIFITFILLFLWLIAGWKSSCRRAMRKTKTKMPIATALCISILLGTSLLTHPLLANAKRLQGEFALSKDAYLLDDNVLWASKPDMEHAPLLDQQVIWSTSRQTLSRKSLVYIYLESYERTYFDAALFPGLTPALAKLEREAITFHGIGQSPLSNWTIAGMVASQCGMPLATMPDTRSDVQRAKVFFPGTDCLGDLLKREGYLLDYIGGADLQFSGKGNFYRRHGFERVIGRDELRLIYGRDMPVHTWGAYDETVLDAAKNRYQALLKSGKPFGLFLLTTTTHPMSGFPGAYCEHVPSYGNGNNSMLNAVACSDRQVAEFVQSLKEKAPDNVVFVVASDHFLVAGDTSALLQKSKNRENLFMVLGKGLEPRVIDRNSTTLDIAPTLASLLGTPMEAMGLGRNLLSAQPTLTEKFGRSRFYSLIPGWRRSLRLKGSSHQIGKMRPEHRAAFGPPSTQ